MLDLEQLLKGVEEESLQNLDVMIGLMTRYQKPVILSAWATRDAKDSALYRKLQQSYLTPYPSPDRAAGVLSRLVEYSEYLGVAGGGR